MPCMNSVVPGWAVSSPDLNSLTKASSSAEKSRKTCSGRSGQRSQGTRRGETAAVFGIVPPFERRHWRAALADFTSASKRIAASFLNERVTCAGYTLTHENHRSRPRCKIQVSTSAPAEPPDTASGSGARPPVAQPGPLQGRRILVIEDEFLIATVVEDILRQAGAGDVVIAVNMQEARTALAERTLDIAMIDIQLDEGAESGLSLGKLAMTRNIPFIFLTGYSRRRASGRVRRRSGSHQALHSTYPRRGAQRRARTIPRGRALSTRCRHRLSARQCVR